MAIKTYDPKENILIVGGSIIGGYQDGEYINAERTEDMYTKYSGADGEAARAKSNNKWIRLVCTLAQTSLSNDVLSALAKLDEESNRGVVPVIFKEINATSLIFSANGFISKMPPIVRSKEIGGVAWAFDLAQAEQYIGGTQDIFTP